MAFFFVVFVVFVFAPSFFKEDVSRISVLRGESAFTVLKVSGEEGSKLDIFVERDRVCYGFKDSRDDKGFLSFYADRGKTREGIFSKEVDLKSGRGMYCSSESFQQVGENTVVVLNQTLDTVLFRGDSFNFTSTLLKKVGEGFSVVGSVWSRVDSDSWKHGGDDNFSSGRDRYRFLYNSSAPIESHGVNYLFSDGVEGYWVKPFFGDNAVCTQQWRNSSGDVVNGSDCSFTLWSEPFIEEVNRSVNESHFEVVNVSRAFHYLQIDFYSNGTIDPLIAPADSYNTVNENVSEEGDGLSHFAHLTVDANGSSIYDQLVAYWSFDTDNSTTAFDLSGNNHNGAFVASGTTNQTDEGYGAHYQGHVGGSDYVNTGMSVSYGNSDSFTWMAWYKSAGSAPTGSNSQHLLGVYDGGTPFIVLRFRPNDAVECLTGYIGFSLSDNSGPYQNVCDTSTVTFDGEWHHAAAVYDDANLIIRLFVDGVEKGNETAGAGTRDAKTLSNNIFIGGLSSGDLGSWAGKLDEVMIFNTALSASQIVDIYNNQSSRFFNRGEMIINSSPITNFQRVTTNFSVENTSGSNVAVRVGSWDNEKGFLSDDPSLVLYMPFDVTNSSGDGNPVDVSQYGNNGTLEGDAKINSTGRFGDAAWFDGDGDYVNAGNIQAIDNATSFGFSAWIKSRNYDQEPQQIIRKYSNGGPTFVFTSGNLQFRFRTSQDVTSLISSNSFDENKWNHIAFSWNGTRQVVYLDGVLQDNDAQSGDNPDPDGDEDLTIGSTDTGTSSFNGSIDEVMIFNRSLSSFEVGELYASGLVNHNVGLNYSFDEQSVDGRYLSFVVSGERYVLESVLETDVYNWYTPYISGNLDWEERNVVPLSFIPYIHENAESQIAVSSNLCVQEDGTLHAAYTSDYITSGSIIYAYSVDNGETWYTKLLSSAGDDYVGISCGLNDEIMIHFADTDFYMFRSFDGGRTFGEEENLADIPTGVVQTNQCAYDSQGNFHCCFVGETTDDLFYVNSSTYPNELDFGLGSNDAQECDIAIGENDCVYIVASSDVQDDLDIWGMGGACPGGGFTDGARVEIHGDFNSFNDNAPMRIRTYEDKIYVAYGLLSHTWFCNSTTALFSSDWDCTELGSTTFQRTDLDIAVDSNGEIHIVMGNISSGGGFLTHYNGTNLLDMDKKVLFETVDNVDYASLGYRNYPVGSRMNGTLRVLFSNNTNSYMTYYNESTQVFPQVFVDVTAPIISDLINQSTTNESSVISWNTNEAANFSISLYNDSERIPSNIVATFDNNTFATSHTQLFTDLTNSTQYFINLTVWDSSGNFVDNNTESFVSAANVVVVGEFEVFVSQGVLLVSEGGRGFGASRGLFGSLFLVGFSDRFGGFFRGAYQVVGLDSVVDRFVGFFEGLFDSFFVGGFVGREGGFFKSLYQSSNIGVSVYRLQNIGRGFYEVLTFDDFVSKSRSRVYAVYQDLSVDSFVSRLSGVLRVVSQGFVVSYFSDENSGFFRGAYQVVGLDNVVDRGFSLTRGLFDSFFVGGFVGREGGFFKSLYQSSNIDVSVYRLQNIGRGFYQAITFSNSINNPSGINDYVVQLYQNLRLDNVVKRGIRLTLNLFNAISAFFGFPPTGGSGGGGETGSGGSDEISAESPIFSDNINQTIVPKQKFLLQAIKNPLNFIKEFNNQPLITRIGFLSAFIVIFLLIALVWSVYDRTIFFANKKKKKKKDIFD